MRSKNKNGREVKRRTGHNRKKAEGQRGEGEKAKYEPGISKPNKLHLSHPGHYEILSHIELIMMQPYSHMHNIKYKNEAGTLPDIIVRKKKDVGLVHTDSLCVRVFIMSSLKCPFYNTSHCGD